MTPVRIFACVALLPLFVCCSSDPNQPANGSGGTSGASGGMGGSSPPATGGKSAGGASPSGGARDAAGGTTDGSGGTASPTGGSHEVSGGSENSGGGSGGAAASVPHILLLSKTAGFRHSSIPRGIAAVQALAADENWIVTATEETSSFTDEGLSAFDALFFLSTTGDILTRPEEAAFERFITRGGSFIGVHAATDTEPDWSFYDQLLGAHFASHPDIQEANLFVEVSNHRATVGLPDPWVRTDEWYNFDRNPREDAQVLLALDEASYDGGTLGADHPIAWTREVGASRLFYTGLGHTEESYSEPHFLAHLRGGIAWVLRDEE